MINKCGNNLPNPNIFKSNLIKSHTESVINLATKNTMDFKHVVLLDIQKAFDSVNWNVLEELLISNLTKKINSQEAIQLVNQYMLILKNRKLLYNKKVIKISKGIPTGLPSSVVVFTLIIERWLYDTKEVYIIDVDYILNIYVDDIYIKFINLHNISRMLSSFINNIEKYMFVINKKKSKVDPGLELTEFPIKLSSNDIYLGIPFTRNINLYGSIILKEYQTRNMHSLTWEQIYIKLISNDKNNKSILGYLNYKLKPLISKSKDESINFEKIINFVKNNFLFTSLYNMYVI